MNDPVGLKGPDGIAAPDKGNVEVLFFDFVVCVAQSVEQEAAEEKQAEAAAPEPKKKANKRRKKRGQVPAPGNANEVQAQVPANAKDDVD